MTSSSLLERRTSSVPDPELVVRTQRLESLGALAGGVAQDLNNVLTPILMSIALLDEQLTDAESRRILAVLEESARRGTEMVRQMLAFSGGLDRPDAAIDLRQLIEDLRRLIAGTFPHAIELVIEVGPGVGKVRGDPTQLHQVILNLCVNARDAMPAGGRLTLRAERVDIDEAFAARTPEARRGRFVCLSVSDTGSGIPADVRPRIFDPFFTTKSLSRGAGLGLSTVQTIVRAHSGFVLVNSHASRGATFQVYLPAATAGFDGDQLHALGDAPRGNGELILVVDDEASVRSITQQLLSAYGYRVITASNGAEAVGEFAKRPGEIGAVLTDMTMPVMDGACTMRALLTIAPDVKLIAATGLEGGHDTFDDMPDVAAVLPKPFHAETVLHVLRHVLDEQAAP